MIRFLKKKGARLTVPRPMDGIFDPLDRVKWDATIFDCVLENDLIWRVIDDSIVNEYKYY